ncbi:shikimate dehydrogenase [Buchnera aphidicola]|uniref:shikimate dehydrogenase n=1 Tax=Buchnera aphidicola TaxID=9 RepID=UPI003463BC49
MNQDKKYNYVLFGTDIHYSKSPMIYQMFSNQTKFNINYEIQSIKEDSFFETLKNFFQNYGKGANVTIPFKEDAYKISDILTNRAKVSGSVNVLKKNKDNSITGDNTDGIGFLCDLKRLNFIHKNKKVLLIGAGGVARGIIPDLLFLGCKIDVVNRTFKRAYNLSIFFKKLGVINAIKINDLKKLNYDIVINAVSLKIKRMDDIFNSDIVFYPERTIFYDVCYSDDMTPFLIWCKDNGALYYSDGIGMLVSQAAYSFYLWSGILPNISSVINILNQNKKYFF